MSQAGPLTVNGGSSIVTSIEGTAPIEVNGVSGVPETGDVVISAPNVVLITGSTMTGDLILDGNPTTANQAANKAYVDAVASGAIFKDPAICATTANLNATYSNGASGVGATLTNAGSMAAFSVDGISPTVGQRVLVKNQTTTFQNGIYSVTTVGSGSVNWVLTRTTDFDSAGTIDAGDVVPVETGTVNADTSWIETSTVNTVGTDPITFIQFTYNPATFVSTIDGDSGSISPSASTVTISGGTTGLTTSGSGSTLDLTGILIGANGGTGVANTGLTINLGSPTTGYVLTSDSSGNGTWKAVSAAGAVTTVDGDAGSATPSSGVITVSGGTTGLTTTASGAAVDLTGTLAVGHGGTGAATLTGVLIGNGTSAVTGNAITQHDVLIGGASNAITSVSPSTSGFVLTSNGTSSDPSFKAISASGAITTIDGDSGSMTPSSGIVTISGGTTGLTTSASSATMDLTGVLTLTNGGTNANLTASLGGIFYSTSTAAAILAGTATAKQVLLSGSSSTPAWSTATYPATTTINQLLYSSSNNVIAGVTAADYGVLISSSSGVPSWLANGTTGQVLTATTSGLPSWETPSTTVSSIAGTSNQIAASASTGAVTLSFTNGISVGSYQSTTPPTGGIIAPGQVFIGSSSSTAYPQLEVTSTLAYNSLFNGTQTAVDAGNNQAGLFVTNTFAPTNGSTASATFDMNSLFSIPSGKTTTNAVGGFFAADFSGNSGTVTNYYGVWVPAATSGGTVTNAHSGYFAAPGVGATVSQALYSDNMSIGYASNNPPTNGLIVSGQVAIGSSSTSGSLTLDLNSTGIIFYIGATASTTTNVVNNIGIWNSCTISTTAAATSSYGMINGPTFSDSGSGTYTNAFGAVFQLNGSATITNAYTAYCSAPSSGTNACALYADNASIGYTATTPPTNGLIVKGNVAIGTSSATNLLTLSAVNTSSGETIKINGGAAQNYISFYNNTTREGYLGTNTGGTGIILDSDVTSLTLQSGNGSNPCYVVASFLGIDGGLSVGSSYYTTAPPSGGLIVQGQVGIGTNSVSINNQFELIQTSSIPQGLFIAGTCIPTAQNSVGITSQPTLGTSSNSYSAFGITSQPSFDTINGMSEGFGIFIGTSTAGGSGTLGTAFGMRISPIIVGSGTAVTNNYSLYVDQATGATNNFTAYFGPGLGVETSNTGATYPLAAVGPAGLSTGTTWTNTSDVRIKKEIQDTEDALPIINALRPRKYRYTDEWHAHYKNKHPDKLYYGLIADEVEKVMPSCVLNTTEYVGETKNLKAVDVHNINILLIKAIQELSSEIQELKGKYANRNVSS